MEANSEQNMPKNEKPPTDQPQEDASDYYNCPIIGKISKWKPSESQCNLVRNGDVSQECLQIIEQSKCPLSSGKAKQIAFVADPPWLTDDHEFWSVRWNFLTDEIPAIFMENEALKHCIEIIYRARNILRKPPIEELQAAWKWIHTDNKICNMLSKYTSSDFDKEYKSIIALIKCYLNNSVITDSEIIALCIIYVAREGFREWNFVLKGISLSAFYTGDEYSFVKDKVSSAGLLLAKAERPLIETNDKQSIVEAPQIKSESIIEKKKGDIPRFPMPSGAKANEIYITFKDKDKEHVNIKVRETVLSLHYSQIGFKHKCSNKPTKLWNTLKIFAVSNGTVTFKKFFLKKGREISSTSEKLLTQDDVKRLNKKLRYYFGFIENERLIYYDEKNCAYKTQFQISDVTEDVKNYKNQLNNDNVDEPNDPFFDQSDDL